jgi:prophage antirepressor-like protein
MLIVNEIGIYDAIFSSRKKEAREFKHWVFNMLKTLRESTGLEGFQVFRMLDKEHQKEAMAKLKASLEHPVRVDFIKANTIANKAVSIKYDRPKMLKKGQMTPQMLAYRQQVLEDTVNLMGVVDKFKLPVSVSQAIYGKYAQ